MPAPPRQLNGKVATQLMSVVGDGAPLALASMALLGAAPLAPRFKLPTTTTPMIRATTRMTDWPAIQYKSRLVRRRNRPDASSAADGPSLGGNFTFGYSQCVGNAKTIFALSGAHHRPIVDTRDLDGLVSAGTLRGGAQLAQSEQAGSHHQRHRQCDGLRPEFENHPDRPVSPLRAVLVLCSSHLSPPRCDRELYREVCGMRVPPPDAAGFHMAVELASATADLAPGHAFFQIVSCLQRGNAVLKELETVEDLRVSVDIDQDPGQSASL